MLMKKGRGSSNFLKLAKACSKVMKLLARCSSMLLNSVQLFLNLAQFGFQIFQTFAQNCLKLGAAGMTGNGQDVSCEKYCVCSANDAAAARHDGRKKGAASHDWKNEFCGLAWDEVTRPSLWLFCCGLNSFTRVLNLSCGLQVAPQDPRSWSWSA